MVDVTVLDLNDNPPVFVNLPYSAVVSKEASENTKVLQVTATDQDKAANADIYYQLVRGNGELFKVARKSGVISLRRRLDSARKEYTLTIAAYDGGSPPYSAEAAVLVKVVDQSVPTFSQQSFRASVAENTETFTPILSTPAESPVSGGKIIYTIERGNEDELFSIDHSGGVVYVTSSLDYETKQFHQLTLRATDSQGGGYSEAVLLVSVEDVNDCAPVFSQETYTAPVSEALGPGAMILRVEATDQDTGPNQDIEFSLRAEAAEQEGGFRIDADTGEIFLERALDHERAAAHHLTVLARDKGPRLGGEEGVGVAQVWVRVQDTNDNAPVFEEAEYQLRLSTRARRGHFVGKVRATDPDTADQNKIQYAIIGGNEHQIFSIEEDTGIINLVNLHNLDSVPRYELNVSVTDGVYSTSTKVRISMESGNLHNPTFAKSVFEVKFRENSPAGSVITTVRAEDGDGDALVYSIESEQLRPVFRLDPATGQLRSERVLDREERASYEIPITVTDGRGRSGFATIKLSLADENDNSPFFPVSEYKANIQANLTVGSTVLRVTADDKDKGKNAAVKYEIYETENSGVADIFAINAKTGQITLQKSASGLDNQVYQFFVRALDSGRAALYADVPIEILVLSVLAQPPVFQEHEKFYFVSESSPVGGTVATLRAGPGPITYSLASTDSLGEEAVFTVDPSSGRVTVSNLLDRETQPLHKLTITAETDASPALLATTELIVYVNDANDHAPEFHSAEYAVTVLENLPAHTQLVQALATDRDIANNGEISYSFGPESRGLASLFSVDPHQGWVRSLAPLDYEAEQSYTLTIVARDNGQPQLSSSTRLTVTLLDTNDNPPSFTQRHYEAAVNEGALPGTIIFQLQMADADRDIKNPVDFFITSGDDIGQFQIKENGEMYVSQALDRETVAQYKMEITATDGVFVSKCRVTIEILDDNDSPPFCTKYFYRKNILENILPGSPILTVTATDADEAQNANKIFSLSGKTKDLFNIDQQSGVLTNALMLDRETQDKHVLTVQVQVQITTYNLVLAFI